MPKDKSIKKVLVIGSGPIVIGQAAEFDYAGTQACRVLKQEGVKVVLVNSNPATIMTDKALADAIYLEPLTVDTVKRIIETEKPDSVLASLGGQTGLTIAMKLHKEGYLEKKGIRLLGTNADAISKAEDRELFKETMQSLGQPCIPSDIATDIDFALETAEKIGYPVIIRPAFTLGGFGGGVAYDKQTFLDIATVGLNQSPIHQILVEKYIYGWKEIEFEVMRDGKGNAIAVCSMENFDPVGIHTGDSIVVAPALTLSDKEYQMLRSASLSIISALGIEGGCNCQFALDPESMNYAVIEVNPRVSRSSALASKATGYPIAKVSARIALGYSLDEIKNEITGKTFACFEPALDYVVVKLPKWPFDKFVHAKRTLGTQMKATGEVMSIAPSFEMALMKAVRGAEIRMETLDSHIAADVDIIERLSCQDDLRLFAVYEALKRGVSIDKVHDITKIDEYFLSCIAKLIAYEKEIANLDWSEELYLKGKKLGYSDKALAEISGKALSYKRSAVFKMVDTCAAEFKAETPYFYATYDKHNEALEYLREKQTVVVLGSGPIRIGQGIEFDYSSVHCAWTLKKLGYDVVIINNNPETVSTDFDVANRLYFEPLTEETVSDVLAIEKPIGVVVAFGGQTALKLTKFLDKNGYKVIGLSPDSIDIAEDRDRFDKLLESFNILRPKGFTAMKEEQAIAIARDLGYPVLVRPSYVIGGQNMTIAYNDADVKEYMDIILSQNIQNPVLIDKYLMGTELEVDGISDGVDVLIPGIMEHIERSGVHSGDSIAVYPSYNLSDVMKQKIVDCSTKITLALNTKGLVNIQYLIYEGELYVIEVNPRASRTIPYISKVTGVPMVDIAVAVTLGAKLADCGYGTGLYRPSPYTAVKVPVFSFEKLRDVNSLLGPEMKSTGEVLGIGKTLEEALFKGLVAAGFCMNYPKNKKCGIYISVQDNDKEEVLRLAKKFYDLGLSIYSTKGTAKAISALGNDITVLGSPNDDDGIYKSIKDGKIQYIVNTCPNKREFVEAHNTLRRIALQSNIACMTSLDTANALADILASRYNEYNTELVDLNNMRTEKLAMNFAKFQSHGSDYIYFENFDGRITFPESLAVKLCDRSFGIGGNGIVLIGKSDVADVKMSMFNADGSFSSMAGSCMGGAAKYIFDKGLTDKTELTVETSSGIKEIKLQITDGKVSSVCINMGLPILKPAEIPVRLSGDSVINRKLDIADGNYDITCVSIGNPHTVIFCKNIEAVPVKKIGILFEFAPIFPERTNVEFVKVVNRRMIKYRVWERGSFESLGCGTAATGAAIAAVITGQCDKDADITVNQPGGNAIVRYTDSGVYLTLETKMVFEGTVLI